jgi:protein kinase A
MPNLGGFLKKKRTKDLPSPTSPVGDSPVTQTSSNEGFQSSNITSSPQTAYTSSQNSSNKVNDLGQLPDGQSSTGPTSEPQNAPLEHTTSRPLQQNPAQADGVSQSDMAGRHNGSTLRDGAAVPTVRTTKGKYTLSDFTIQRTLGTGSFGRVHLVQSKHNQRFYAVKVLKKQQVVKMKQVEHTNDERRMLQRVKHPFLITLWGTFQDSKNLYMVMDFVEGGELFSLLRKSQVSDLRFLTVVKSTLEKNT